MRLTVRINIGGLYCFYRSLRSTANQIVRHPIRMQSIEMTAVIKLTQKWHSIAQLLGKKINGKLNCFYMLANVCAANDN